MSRNIDFDKPLSTEDRAWLHEWSMDWRIAENDRKFSETVQNISGPVITQNPDNAIANPRLPHNFPEEKVATGPVYPVANHPQIQQYANTVGQLPGTTVEPAPQPEPEAVDIEDLTVDELKSELKNLDQPVTGNKAELQDRLTKALED
jgi:hypothetical protein